MLRGTRSYCIEKEGKAAWQTGRPRSDRGNKAVTRQCEFCGADFNVGGRDATGKRLPPKDQRFCSRLCALRARPRVGSRCLPLSPAFIGWVAGYFDGEGSAFLEVQGAKRRPYAQVTIGSTDRTVIRDIFRETGVGDVTTRTSKTDKHRDLFMWKCCSQAAESFLEQLKPCIIIKRAIVDQVLSSCHEMEATPTLAYDPGWRANAAARSKVLNQRGPAGQELRSRLKPTNTADQIRESIMSCTYSPLAILGVSTACGIRPATESKVSVDPQLKVCPVCGTLFPRRRHTTKRNPNVTCSKACGYIHRRRCGTSCRRILPHLAMRLAGYIDAEGCIQIKQCFRTIHAGVHFGNTNELIVKLIAEIAGVGKVTRRRARRKEHATSWHWRIQCDAAQGLLEQIIPYLRTKKRQACLALYVQERLAIPQSRIDRLWHAEALQVSKLLNAKGRVAIPEEISVAGGKLVI